MAYELSSDETYFLSQFLAKVESNKSIKEVPFLWMPDHFDENTFEAAYYKFSVSVCPEVKILNSEYYFSVDFTELQTASIQAWVEWYQAQVKPKVRASLARDAERKAQNEYYKAAKKRLEDLRLERRKKEQEKDKASVSSEETWGRLKKPKIEDDGNTWREQT